MKDSFDTSSSGTSIGQKAEDSQMALWLFVLAISCIPLSAPMFLTHFREAVRVQHNPVGVISLFIFEVIKVALFSGVAVWTGKHFASDVGLDAPVVRSLVQGRKNEAFRVALKALPFGMLVGLLGFLVKLGITSIFRGANLIELLNLLDHDQTPFTIATGVFYSFAITLWFRW